MVLDLECLGHNIRLFSYFLFSNDVVKQYPPGPLHNVSTYCYLCLLMRV